MTARDIVMSAAGNAGDSKTYIEDVFSTYLYTGTGAAQTINNGIDLAGKGGMVWCKLRSTTGNNNIHDTVRGYPYTIFSESTSAQTTSDAGKDLTSFNSDGFSIGPNNYCGINTSGETLVSWTFRKAPKFFDVVTWTGDGSSSKVISHALGQTPGMILVKATSSTGYWAVWQRTINNTGNGYMFLNTSQSQFNDGEAIWGNGTTYTAPTDANFTISSYANASGVTYVAYLFGHDTTTDGLIQCGSFTTDGASTTTVNLGWEPQYVMVKVANGATGAWYVMDTMRGLTVNNSANTLLANNSGSETANSGYAVTLTSTGFTIPPTSNFNSTGYTYIYMAIRRGPMKTPTDGTKVFKPLANTTNGTTGFPVDVLLGAHRTSTSFYPFVFASRLQGNNQLQTSSTAAETNGAWSYSWPSNTGLYGGISDQWVNECFQRAPGFFDVVCYTGTGVARTVNHNLGVAPELMIVKRRDSASNWNAYSAPTGNTQALLLDGTTGAFTFGVWNNTTPTSTVFNVATQNAVNASGGTFVAYLFASCPGVSKVGSYTGNGSSQTINCGFTNGARFVLIKRTDSTGDWFVWDTARGIVSSTDPHLSLNTTAAEVTSDDTINPDSTGFIVNQYSATNVNVNSASYIYLAIA